LHTIVNIYRHPWSAQADQGFCLCFLEQTLPTRNELDTGSVKKKLML
jgi:hypothetical protein